MTYHRIVSKSNTTDVTTGAGTVTVQGLLSSPLVFYGFRFCVVNLHIFRFFGSCCDVLYDFHTKTVFASSFLCFVRGGGMWVVC